MLLTNCDKITPGMLMGAARLNIPVVVVTAGPMYTGIIKINAVRLSEILLKLSGSSRLARSKKS